jgi:crotonobetaine/carnitine-CoA ligase
MESDTSWPTLIDLLAARANETPARIFLDFEGETWSYLAVAEEVERRAGAFADIGMRKGDRVCLMMDNSSDMALTILGLLRVGIVVVPINTAFRGEFLRHQIADSQAAAVVVDDAQATAVIALLGEIPGVRHLIVRGDVPGDGTLENGRVRLRSLSAIVAAGQPFAGPAPVSTDTAFLLYTSGTTGPSKGCIVSHAYIANVGRHSVECHALGADTVFWTPLPMFHIGCLGQCVAGTLTAGGTASIARRFSVSAFWPEIERSRATLAMIISVMLTYVAEAPVTDPERRCYGQLQGITGAPLPAEMRQLFKRRFGVKWCAPAGYGLTEATQLIINHIAGPECAPGDSSGRPRADFEIKIVADNGEECAPGQPGNILARPRCPGVMMDGYWGNEAATKEVFVDGWFRTGDIGVVDADGWFFFVDRAKDYLRRGGENISSFEMEAAFRRHPDVVDVAVHAVKSQRGEDDVKVTAVLRPGCSLTEEDLYRWSIDQVPRFAVPRYVEFRADLPRNAVGRIQHFRLRDQGVTAATWDREKSHLVVPRAPTTA